LSTTCYGNNIEFWNFQFCQPRVDRLDGKLPFNGAIDFLDFLQLALYFETLRLPQDLFRRLHCRLHKRCVLDVFQQKLEAMGSTADSQARRIFGFNSIGRKYKKIIARKKTKPHESVLDTGGIISNHGGNPHSQALEALLLPHHRRENEVTRIRCQLDAGDKVGRPIDDQDDVVHLPETRIIKKSTGKQQAHTCGAR